MNRKTLALAFMTFMVVASLTAKGFSRDPGEVASSLISSADRVGNLYVLRPDSEVDSGYGLVFYPGGLVEAEAYLPLLDAVRQRGVMAVLVPMPWDLAVLAPRRGLRAFDEVDDGRKWALAGHSLGGVMAASLLDKVPDSPFEALILLASYPPGSADLSTTTLRALSLAASEDLLAEMDDVRDGLERLPPGTRLIEIEGGNHAGFGDYGEQKGDGVARIPQSEQWEITADWVVKFLLGPRL